MKKSILWVDLILLLVFATNIISNFVNFPFKKIIQPLFFVLTIIHIIQHWRIFVTIIKNLMSNSKQSSI